MRRIKRRTLLVFAGVLAAGITSFYFYGKRVAPLNADGSVGMTEAELVSRFGEPSDHFAGSFGDPPVSYLAGHKEIETTTWKRSSGTLYVSTSTESGRRVCFEAFWLPKGAQF